MGYRQRRGSCRADNGGKKVRAFVTRNGTSIPSGSLVLPEENIMLKMLDLPWATTQVVFTIYDSNGNVLLQRESYQWFENEPELSILAPNTLGNYKYIATAKTWGGTRSEDSPPFNFQVSNAAPELPNEKDWTEKVADIFKWVAIGGGVILVGYFVLQSGGIARAAGRARSEFDATRRALRGSS